MLHQPSAEGIGGIWRASFGELVVSTRGWPHLAHHADVYVDGGVARAHRPRYGGTTEDEHGRRISLEKFIAASVVFLAQALAIETERARRLLRFLLAKECRLDPRTFAARRWAGPSRGSRAGTGCRLRVAASGSGRECGRAAATDAELTLAVCSYADGLRRAADGAAAMG